VSLLDPHMAIFEKDASVFINIESKNPATRVNVRCLNKSRIDARVVQMEQLSTRQLAARF
jgi:hypothetical protein